MDPDFWHKRWEENQIGFHNSDTNPLLLRHFPKLGLMTGQRVFIPLCGKTLDIAWLLIEGFEVVGAELSEIAVTQLFENLKVTPEVNQHDSFKHYHAESIDIFVGNIFDLGKDVIGRVDAVYDRAALVALPPEMRVRYATHLSNISENAPQLLITFEYDQTKMDGPPFSVPNVEVQEHYKSVYHLEALENFEIEGGMKGKTPARETVWHLKKP